MRSWSRPTPVAGAAAPGVRRPPGPLSGSGRCRRRTWSTSTAGLATGDDDLDPAPTHRDDMAFWLYSSGSTGRPKGVVHLHARHRGHVRDLRPARAAGCAATTSRFSTTKLFHAYGLGNALSFPLWAGATSVLMQGRPRPQPILETLRRHRPTVFFSVPALYGDAVPRARGRGRVRIGAPLRLGRRGAAAADVRALSRTASGSRSSTGSARPRCSTSTAPTRPTSSSPAPPDARFRATSCGSSTSTAPCSTGPAVGDLEVRGRLVRRLLLAPAREDQRSMRGEWFRIRRPLRAPRRRRLRLRGPRRRHAQGRRPVGVADRHGARACSSTRGSPVSAWSGSRSTTRAGSPRS